MRINPNLIKTTPRNLPFSFCVYGEPISEIEEWLSFWGIEKIISKQYTNFLIPENIKLKDIFEEAWLGIQGG